MSCANSSEIWLVFDVFLKHFRKTSLVPDKLRKTNSEVGLVFDVFLKHFRKTSLVPDELLKK
jgi:hypothetical protein